MQETDRAFVFGIDRHMDAQTYANMLYTRSGYIIWEQGRPAGVLHYCMIWDRLPFLNLIYVLPEYRNRGLGSQALELWEEKMEKRGYKMVMVSTQVDEEAQRLYRRRGYVDCGGWILAGTPFDQPMELFLRKVLGEK